MFFLEHCMPVRWVKTSRGRLFGLRVALATSPVCRAGVCGRGCLRSLRADSWQWLSLAPGMTSVNCGLCLQKMSSPLTKRIKSGMGKKYLLFGIRWGTPGPLQLGA